MSENNDSEYWGYKTFHLLQPNDEYIHIYETDSREHNEDLLNYAEQSFAIEQELLAGAIFDSERRHYTWGCCMGAALAIPSFLCLMYDLPGIITAVGIGVGAGFLVKVLQEKLTRKQLQEALDEVYSEQDRLAETRKLVCQQRR